MTRHFAYAWIAAAALAAGLAAPAAAQDRRGTGSAQPVERPAPAPKPDDRGIVWTEIDGI